MWHVVGLLVLLSEAGALRASVTPVQKVATLLLKIRDKVQDQGTSEAAGYDKFACFCKEEADNKVYYIDKSDTLIKALQAEIDSLGGDVTQLDSDIGGPSSGLKGDLAADELLANTSRTDALAAQGVYEKKRANLTEGVQVITDAIEHLRTKRDESASVKADAEGGVEGLAMLSKTRKALEGLGYTSFLQQPLQTEIDTAEALAAPAYKYQSGDVIATLQGLSQTFKAELARCDEEYGLAKHDRDMADGVRFMKMKSFKDDIRNKEKLSAFKTEEKVKKEVERDEETTAMGRDQGFLDDLTTSCTAKATAWDVRSRIRASEITTLTQAANVLQGMEGLYKVNAKLVGLQLPSVRTMAPALIQLRGSDSNFGALVRFLSGRADALHSSRIAALAQTLRATAAIAQVTQPLPNVTVPTDHFVEVRSIVKDLIARLEAEALSEATAKSLCDTQMKSAVEKRDARTADMETAGAGIDATDSAIHGLTNDISTMSDELADMNKALKDMTDLRLDEKTRAAMSLKDANDGLNGINQAIELLRNFYERYELIQKEDAAPAAPSTTFFPQGGNRDGRTVSDLAPESFDDTKRYQGQQKDSKGLFAMLTVIASDFERTIDNIDGDEKAAVTAFGVDSKKLNGEIGLKGIDKGNAEGSKSTKEGELITLKDDKKTATTLHGAALTELGLLTTSCVDGEESWEARRDSRKKEIEALKQAHTMLEDWKN